MAAAPKTAEVEHDLAVADRFVRFDPAPHGMVTLYTLLPAPEAMRVKTAVCQLAITRRNNALELAEAAGTDAPALSMDAYRADALIELADLWLNGGDPSAAIPDHFPAIVQVVVSIETLRNIDRRLRRTR
jgi:hypothetical protein